MNQCSKNCKLYLLQKFIECEQGYCGNKCIPKFGDAIKVQEEECDDGHQYEVDTCLNCNYQCPQYCTLCAQGVCTLCFEGFYLDIETNSCSSVCGDTILAKYEVCDDSNEVKYDGCFQCNYQCQMECLNFQFGKCLECESPSVVVKSKGSCEQFKQCEGLIGLYHDDFFNDCLPQCGDGIVAGTEQCDDQNNTPQDGCYECKYQQQIGSLLYLASCIPICGDGIVINEYEECDDQNDQPYDGCFECQFLCIKNCLVCQKGICLYLYNLIQKIIKLMTIQILLQEKKNKLILVENLNYLIYTHQYFINIIQYCPQIKIFSSIEADLFTNILQQFIQFLGLILITLNLKLYIFLSN